MSASHQPEEPATPRHVPDKLPAHDMAHSQKPSHTAIHGSVLPPEHPDDDSLSWADRMRHVIIGRPRDLRDQSLFHHISLIAILAWVGLGADGLSSSCYGPAEAFIHLGAHTYLAIFLAIATILTVAVISLCYSHIIEEFPSGGGGYLVASKLLGKPAGVVSGCALLIDYVLTISISVAAGGQAIFAMLDPAWDGWRVPAELAVVLVLVLLNLRGIRESITSLLPIFAVFLLTHLILILGAMVLNVDRADDVALEIVRGVRDGLADPQLGLWGLAGLLLFAYSLGAGTYTGIEAVSNSVPAMREPRVETAKRTMLYMAASLAFTSGGLIVAYLLLGIQPAEGKTMNQLLTESFMGELGLRDSVWGEGFVWVTLASEAALLFVAAQAGFIDGPRVLANMARDAWAPNRFANLSDRLTMRNGVLFMGLSAVAALVYTHGDVAVLIIMYSINVFLTFSLSMIGMSRHWWQLRSSRPEWRRRLALFVLGAALCVSILVVTIVEKFEEGAWRTLLATGVCIGACTFIHWHYQATMRRLQQLDRLIEDYPVKQPSASPQPPDPKQPAAAVLVGGYSGLGIHTLLAALRLVPGHFRSAVFVSVGVVDSGVFKGVGQLDALEEHTRQSLQRYVDYATRLGLPAMSYMSLGTDSVDELEALCRKVCRDFPNAVVFAGKLVFQREQWYHRILHNRTAYALQRRLEWSGVPLVILPTRVR
jgi:amino acid transporter